MASFPRPHHEGPDQSPSAPSAPVSFAERVSFVGGEQSAPADAWPFARAQPSAPTENSRAPVTNAQRHAWALLQVCHQEGMFDLYELMLREVLEAAHEPPGDVFEDDGGNDTLVYVYGFTEDSDGNRQALRRVVDEDGNVVDTDFAARVEEP